MQLRGADAGCKEIYLERFMSPHRSIFIAWSEVHAVVGAARDENTNGCFVGIDFARAAEPFVPPSSEQLEGQAYLPALVRVQEDVEWCSPGWPTRKRSPPIRSLSRRFPPLLSQSTRGTSPPKWACCFKKRGYCTYAPRIRTVVHRQHQLVS